MDWLNPINQAEIHAAASRKREQGTGKWFLEGGAFANWRQDPGTSLWLIGDGRTQEYPSSWILQLTFTKLDAVKPFSSHPSLTFLKNQTFWTLRADSWHISTVSTGKGLSTTSPRSYNRLSHNFALSITYQKRSNPCTIYTIANFLPEFRLTRSSRRHSLQ